MEVVDEDKTVVLTTLEDDQNLTKTFKLVPTKPALASVFFDSKPVIKSPFKIAVEKSEPSQLQFQPIDEPISTLQFQPTLDDQTQKPVNSKPVDSPDETSLQTPHQDNQPQQPTQKQQKTQPQQNLQPQAAESSQLNQHPQNLSTTQPVQPQHPNQPSQQPVTKSAEVKVYGPAVELPILTESSSYFIVDTKKASPGKELKILQTLLVTTKKIASHRLICFQKAF